MELRLRGLSATGLKAALAVRLAVEFLDAPWDRPVEDRRTARGTVEELQALVRAYAAAGVTHLIVDAASGDLAQVRERWERFYAEVAQPIAPGG